jgi:hypothetical protein
LGGTGGPTWVRRGGARTPIGASGNLSIITIPKSEAMHPYMNNP